MNALDQEQRCAGVPQVVKPHRWQAGLIEQPMEAMCHVWSVGERAELAGEYQVELDPVRASREPLKDLPCAMSAQSADHDGRHDQRAATSWSFRLDELGALTWNSLRGSPNAKNAGIKIDVAPFEAQGLALSQPERQSDRVQRLETIATRGVEQPSSVFRRQDLRL